MLYRWPQGRIIRVIAMIIVALVAFDFGREAWGAYDIAFGPAARGGLTAMVTFGVLAVLAVGVGLSGMFMIGFHPRSAQFLIEVESEMTRVTWPTRSELLRLTIVIAILALVLTGLIFVVDLVNLAVKEQIFKLGSSLGGG